MHTNSTFKNRGLFGFIEEEEESSHEPKSASSKGFITGHLDKLKRLGGTTLRRRKLLVRGIPPSNSAALENVKHWCQVLAAFVSASSRGSF